MKPPEQFLQQFLTLKQVPRVVLSKKEPQEKFQPVQVKDKPLEQFLMAQELLEQVLLNYETRREDPPRSRALRPVFSRAFRTHREGFRKEEPSF